MLGFMDQYILVTDIEVLFLKNISLADFGELPQYISCGYESAIDTRCNNGIMLFHVSNMALSYDPFMKFVLRSHNDIAPGIFFQSSINSFFNDKNNLSKYLNWLPNSPSWRFEKENVKILSFNNPSLDDLRNLIDNGIINDRNFNSLKKCLTPGNGCLEILQLYNSWLDKIKS